jgi:hypothetical protein
MRTHQQIIDDAGGPAAVSATLNAAIGAATGLEPGSEGAVWADPGKVKQWKRNNSIPSGWLKAFADTELATTQELLEAAAHHGAMIAQVSPAAVQAAAAR